jgi:hypothetical protein
MPNTDKQTAQPSKPNKPTPGNKPEQSPNAKPDKAIHYNENAEAYAKSGKVEPNAKKAVEALDDMDEAIELQAAETKGKSHANRPRMTPDKERESERKERS